MTVGGQVPGDVVPLIGRATHPEQGDLGLLRGSLAAVGVPAEPLDFVEVGRIFRAGQRIRPAGRELLVVPQDERRHRTPFRRKGKRAFGSESPLAGLSALRVFGIEDDNFAGMVGLSYVLDRLCLLY